MARISMSVTASPTAVERAKISFQIMMEMSKWDPRRVRHSNVLAEPSQAELWRTDKAYVTLARLLGNTFSPIFEMEDCTGKRRGELMASEPSNVSVLGVWSLCGPSGPPRAIGVARF